jgi:hypothetical protein
MLRNRDRRRNPVSKRLATGFLACGPAMAVQDFVPARRGFAEGTFLANVPVRKTPEF